MGADDRFAYCRRAPASADREAKLIIGTLHLWQLWGAHTYTHTRKNMVSYSRASASELQSKAKDAASLCPPGYKSKFTNIFIGIPRAYRHDATLGNRSFGPCLVSESLLSDWRPRRSLD